MKIIQKLSSVALLFTLLGCTEKLPSSHVEHVMPKDMTSDQMEDVALYIKEYEKLPTFYMTKKEARSKGWEGGALNQVIEGKAIGGDVFGNYEGVLPEIDGTYYECDIDTLNKESRGTKRIVYNDDSLDIDIYYTDDHYETFDLLYGDGLYEGH